MKKRPPTQRLGQFLRRHGDLLTYVSLSLLMLGYTAFYSTVAILLHQTFYTNAFDLGQFDQALWLMSQGKSPFITVAGMDFISEAHPSFLMFPLALVYRIWDDVHVILILQTIALAAGALPIFWIARDALKSPWLALALAGAYLFNPALINANLTDFHSQSFEIPFLLFAFYFLMTGSTSVGAGFSLLAILTHPEITIGTMALGLYTAFTFSRRRGLLIAFFSLLWFSAIFLAGWGTGRFSGAGSYGGFSAHLFDPSWYWDRFMSTETARYLFHLLGPLAFLPLFSPATFFMAAPNIIANLLGAPHQRTILYQYTIPVIPFLFISAIYGAAFFREASPLCVRLPALIRKRGVILFVLKAVSLRGRSLMALSCLLLLASSLYGNITLVRHIPFNRIPSRVAEFSQALNRPDIRAAARAFSLIPADASVSADHLLVPHLTHRDRIYMFPNPWIRELWGWGLDDDRPPHDPLTIQYIIVHQATMDAKKEKLLSDLLASGLFAEIVNKDEIRLLKRLRTDPGGNS